MVADSLGLLNNLNNQREDKSRKYKLPVPVICASSLLLTGSRMDSIYSTNWLVKIDMLKINPLLIRHRISTMGIGNRVNASVLSNIRIVSIFHRLFS